MNTQEIDQIKNIFSNFEDAQKKIPYYEDLVNHPAFGPIFSSFSQQEKADFERILQDYILERLDAITKTKGGQLFARFAEAHSDLFWEFRRLNAPQIDDPNFQVLGKQVEIEMFKLEGILTEKMLKQEKGLDKVVDSFYTIVYSFFPRFNEIN